MEQLHVYNVFFFVCCQLSWHFPPNSWSVENVYFPLRININSQKHHTARLIHIIKIGSTFPPSFFCVSADRYDRILNSSAETNTLVPEFNRAYDAIKWGKMQPPATHRFLFIYVAQPGHYIIIVIRQKTTNGNFFCLWTEFNKKFPIPCNGRPCVRVRVCV